MGELQKLYVTLALDAAQYNEGLKDAQTQATGFADRIRGRVGGAVSALGPIARGAFLGVGAAAVGGFGMAMKSAIDMNAQLETSTLQFTTLMGDADKATAHVAGLFEFAEKTPFETQPIIDASLALQTFGGESLNTMENLTLVGDAAAAVGAPFDEVAFWVGRLYSNLQAGQPFGEAAMRLQELGIMTPQARTELEMMQETGASGTEMFATFQGQLGRFTGAMEAQAGTWQGLTSTIKDQLNIMVAGALKPFFELMKTGLAGVVEWLNNPAIQAGLQKLAQGFADTIKRVAEFVTTYVVPFVQQHGPALRGALIAVAAAFGALVVIGGIITLLNLLFNPITLIIAVVAALGAAWASNWGGIQDKTRAVVTFLRGLIETFLANVRAWWAEHGEAIMATAEKAWNLIKGLIDGVVKHIQLVVEMFRAAFEGDWERFGELIFEIWQNAWETVVNFLSGLWDMVLPWLSSLWESIKTWFVTTDWKQLGLDIINGIVNGLRSAGQAIIDVIKGFATAAWEAVKAFFGISSPSTLMFYAGEMIAQGLIEGIRSKYDDAAEAMDELFKMMGTLGNLGGGFAGFFKSRTLDPLKDELDGVNKALKDMGEALGVGVNDPNAVLRLQRMAADAGLTAQERDTARVMLSFLQERARLNQEYVRQQERLAQLEEKRQQIAFLQQQLDLIKLVKENGLDASILEGIQFGLDADAGGLMDAMVAAMKAMIEAAEAELGISSPSKVARSLMENFFETAALTAKRESASLERALSGSLSAALDPVTAVGGGRVDNSRRTVINGGVHYYNRGGSSTVEDYEVLAR